jgi:RNA polymerase sigma-70 factor (ECF subfamily)
VNDSDIETLLTLAGEGDDSAKQNLLNCHRDRPTRMVSLFLDARLSARIDPSDVVQEALACGYSN